MKVIKLTESDLTNMVKRVIKENSAKDTLIDMIKEEGWNSAAEMVGGYKNLKKLSGIIEPIDFLNLFNDLNVDMNDDNSRGILTNNEGDRVISITTSKNNKLFALVNTSIWYPLEFGFLHNNAVTANLVREWLKDVYGIKVNLAKKVAF
jgi:hypothetical protein